MNVLMQIRSNVYDLPGGDTIQMQKTKRELEALGHKIDISLELRPDLSGYDVVHLFNVTRVQETYIQMENVVQQKKPVVLSTIYWPNDELEKTGGLGIRHIVGHSLSIDRMESLKALAKYILQKNRDEGTKYLITHSYQEMQRYILEHADVYLPNAIEEMRQIETHLGFKAESQRIVVVPNAIDVEALKFAIENPDGKYKKYKDWLVCVGRIEARKNQLKLLDAIQDSDYCLLLIGKCSPGHKKYFKRTMKKIEKTSRIEYIEQISNTDLYQVFANCRVSILPSWYETPGLVSLEAASMGCNIVVSPKGTTRDYFGDDAFYCDVMDSRSIREQIDKAYNAPFHETFREKILSQYTWREAAVATERGYYIALEKSKNRDRQV